MSAGPQTAVLLVGIGQVPASLLGSAELVLGELQQVAALGFEHPRDPEALRGRIAAAAAEIDGGRGVLLLADLCGSTVANACYGLLRERQGYEVLCGANLAMLMKLAALDRRELGATNLARALADTGRRGINIATDVLAADRGAGEKL